MRRKAGVLVGMADGIRPAAYGATMMAGHGELLIPGLKTKGALAGRYRIEQLLGSGRTGVVVAARHAYLRRRVTLKLFTGSVGKQPLAAAQKATLLKNEHVARIVDTGFTSDGVPFIATERFEGEPLRAEMTARGQVAYDEAVRVIVQACDGLAEAHAAGIVHGDLKPENLLVANGGVVKILDFGMPSQGDGDDAWFGTPAYLAPEQVSSGLADERADIWALGVILHEMIAGALPFGGETVSAMLVAVATAEPVDLVDVANVPPRLAAVVKSCLAKDPADRPADVASLARALAPYVGSEGMALARRVADGTRVEERAEYAALAKDEAAQALIDADDAQEAEDGAKAAPFEQSGMTVPIVPVVVEAPVRPVRNLRRALGAPRRAELRGVVAFVVVLASMIAVAGLWSAVAPGERATFDENASLVPAEALVPAALVPASFSLEPENVPAPRTTAHRREDHGFTHPARLR